MDENLKKNLNEKLSLIFQQKLGVKFESGLKRKAVPQWDSLNHVKLILMVEKEFGVSFSIPEAVAIQSTDDLIKTLSDKCP